MLKGVTHSNCRQGRTRGCRARSCEDAAAARQPVREHCFRPQRPPLPARTPVEWEAPDASAPPQAARSWSRSRGLDVRVWAVPGFKVCRCSGFPACGVVQSSGIARPGLGLTPGPWMGLCPLCSSALGLRCACAAAPPLPASPPLPQPRMLAAAAAAAAVTHGCIGGQTRDLGVCIAAPWSVLLRGCMGGGACAGGL